MWNNTYLVKDKDFSGLVLFHSTGGDFVNGWRYTNGKVTHTVDVNFDEGFGISLKSGYYDCAEYPVIGWFQDCTDYFTIGEVDGNITSISYTGTSCDAPYMDYMGTSMQCTYVDDGNEGTYGGGYGSGNSAFNNFFEEVVEKINLNSPLLLQEVVCFLENLVQNGGNYLVPDVFEGAGDKFLAGYNIATKNTSYMGHKATVTVVYDYSSAMNEIKCSSVKHGSQVIYHEISVIAPLDNFGGRPNLVLLRFPPQETTFVNQIWNQIKGESRVWDCY